MNADISSILAQNRIRNGQNKPAQIQNQQIPAKLAKPKAIFNEIPSNDQMKYTISQALELKRMNVPLERGLILNILA